MARDNGRLLHAPHIPYLSERDNTRRGFLDPAALLNVLAFLPEHYQMG